jgi:hypothetical protein
MIMDEARLPRASAPFLNGFSSLDSTAGILFCGIAAHTPPKERPRDKVDERALWYAASDLQHWGTV